MDADTRVTCGLPAWADAARAASAPRGERGCTRRRACRTACARSRARTAGWPRTTPRSTPSSRSFSLMPASMSRSTPAVRRFQNTAPAPTSSTSAGSTFAASPGAQHEREPRSLRRSPRDANDPCNHQRAAPPMRRTPSDSSSRMYSATIGFVAVERRTQRRFVGEPEFVAEPDDRGRRHPSTLSAAASPIFGLDTVSATRAAPAPRPRPSPAGRAELVVRSHAVRGHPTWGGRDRALSSRSCDLAGCRMPGRRRSGREESAARQRFETSCPLGSATARPPATMRV